MSTEKMQIQCCAGTICTIKITVKLKSDYTHSVFEVRCLLYRFFLIIYSVSIDDNFEVLYHFLTMK
jgi:hypothetical protein